jgi:hypothetical protein
MLSVHTNTIADLEDNYNIVYIASIKINILMLVYY